MPIGLGLGLGLGLHSGTPPPANPSSELFCRAIAETKLVSFKFQGSSVLAEPYAVIRTGKGASLLAVVLRSENAALNKWRPKRFDLKRIKDQEISGETFLPSAAFDASGFDETTEIICAIKIV